MDNILFPFSFFLKAVVLRCLFGNKEMFLH